MRNEYLHAYSLHQRPFQDKRSIYYLFTLEHGILHGIAKKGVPQFVPLTLFASGKKALKTLQQVTIADSVPALSGHNQYAALYVNEITLKLLAIEDSAPNIYDCYKHVVSQLQTPLDITALKLVLRQYEHALFSELGIAIDFMVDSEQQPISSEHNYRYHTESGWQMVESETDNNFRDDRFSGKDIKSMQKGLSTENLQQFSILHRQIIDFLFDYKPLQSRILWQQFIKYQ